MAGIRIKPFPSREYLHSVLICDPDTGTLTWKIRDDSGGGQSSRFNKLHGGRSAGGRYYDKRTKYHLQGLQIDGVRVSASRVVWTMINGPIPDDKWIDHWNGDSLDNRPCNLRLADFHENNHNRKRASNNTSGYKGVSVDGTRFRVGLMCHGKRIRIGGFKTAFGAALEYDRLAVEHHGEFARLNFPEKHSLTWQEK